MRKRKAQRCSGRRLLAFLLCLSLLSGFLPALAKAAENGERLAGIVKFQSITLHYAAENGQPEGAAIQDNILIEKERLLILRYAYEITEEQCSRIEADTPYYLEVSPHLILPDLGSQGSALTMETEDGPRKFGAIFADGSRAWVVFEGQKDGSGTVLSEYGELKDAFFYLNCSRAGAPPKDEVPIDGTTNLYAMKFEDGGQLRFGYREMSLAHRAARIRPVHLTARIHPMRRIHRNCLTLRNPRIPQRCQVLRNLLPGQRLRKDLSYRALLIAQEILMLQLFPVKMKCQTVCC